MRDLVLLGILPLLIYTSLKRPFIGIGLWLWSSAINLNQLVYGVAGSIPFAKLFAGVSIISFLISKDKTAPKIEIITFFIILFYVIATLSNIFGIGNEDVAWSRWVLFTKIIVFYFFALGIIKRKIHFDFVAWMLIISIGALSSTEGLKFLFSGGGHRVYDISGVAGDNNFFGVMIVAVLPLACYIYGETRHKILKLGVLGVIILMILGIFSTYSRGAFLGLIVFTIFFWKSSNHKIIWLFGFSMISILLIDYMPDTWINRMDTVENADTDSSFMGRVIAWKIAILIAMDNFLGGGFRAVENQHVWLYYAQDFDKLDFISTPPVLSHYKATHSAYFQVLSNHGFIGLFVFLSMLLAGYLKASIIIYRCMKYKLEKWIIRLAKMIQLSLLTYSVSGAAVNVAYFDFLYAILALIVSLSVITKEKVDDIRKNSSNEA